MAFFHDSGDHSRESPSGKEEVELVGVRGVVDATLRLVFVDVDVDGVKAAAPPTRLAAKITDNLIVYDMCMCNGVQKYQWLYYSITRVK